MIKRSFIFLYVAAIIAALAIASQAEAEKSLVFKTIAELNDEHATKVQIHNLVEKYRKAKQKGQDDLANYYLTRARALWKKMNG